MSICIKNPYGDVKYYKSNLVYSINNYEIIHLLDYDVFFLLNKKNNNMIGFIINEDKSDSDKCYYYYNLYHNKVCYIYNMNIDDEHQSNTKDMICKTKEILERDKINKVKKLFY